MKSIKKERKLNFIHWLISKYGYINNDDDLNKLSNSRILSETYYKETNINIPKLTIYRWLKNIDRLRIVEYEKIALDYINKGIR